MTRTRIRTMTLLIAVVAVLGAAYGVFAVATGTASYADEAAADAADRGKKPRTLEVDIAENGTRFVFDEAPVFEDGFPRYGNPFLTEGYIYPAGTLTDTNGVNPDGSPEFPDKVIGQWLCRGYFIGDGAHTTEGSWVFTTQLFAFGDDPDTGKQTVVVTGYEGAVVGEPVIGAVTGGTGKYATARGEATQVLLGFNNPDNPDAHGINKTVNLRIVRR